MKNSSVFCPIGLKGETSDSLQAREKIPPDRQSSDSSVKRPFFEIQDGSPDRIFMSDGCSVSQSKLQTPIKLTLQQVEFSDSKCLRNSADLNNALSERCGSKSPNVVYPPRSNNFATCGDSKLASFILSRGPQTPAPKTMLLKSPIEIKPSLIDIRRLKLNNENKMNSPLRSNSVAPLDEDSRIMKCHSTSNKFPDDEMLEYEPDDNLSDIIHNQKVASQMDNKQFIHCGDEFRILLAEVPDKALLFSIPVERVPIEQLIQVDSRFQNPSQQTQTLQSIKICNFDSILREAWLLFEMFSATSGSSETAKPKKGCWALCSSKTRRKFKMADYVVFLNKCSVMASEKCRMFSHSLKIDLFLILHEVVKIAFEQKGQLKAVVCKNNFRQSKNLLFSVLYPLFDTEFVRRIGFDEIPIDGNPSTFSSSVLLLIVLVEFCSNNKWCLVEVLEVVERKGLTLKTAAHLIVESYITFFITQKHGHCSSFSCVNHFSNSVEIILMRFVAKAASSDGKTHNPQGLLNEAIGDFINAPEKYEKHYPLFKRTTFAALVEQIGRFNGPQKFSPDR